MTLLRATLLVAAFAAPAVASAQTAAPPVSPWGTPAPGLAMPLPPPPAAAESDAAQSFERLRGTIAWFQDEERTQRRAVIITGSAVGAVGLGVGVGLMLRGTRSDPMYGLFIGAAGLGFVLGSTLSLLLPDEMSPVRDAMENARRANRSAEHALAVTEAAWSRQATRGRRVRRIGGAVMLGTGLAGMIAGAVLMFTYRGSGTLRPAMSTLSMGLGATFAVAGAGLTFAPSYVEQGWEVYRRARGLPLEIGVTPLQGGAMVGVGGEF